MSESYSIPLPSHPRFKDLTGRAFGRLTVLSYAGKPDGKHHSWRTQCVCGSVQHNTGCNLTRGLAKSCGCLRADWAAEHHRKHGLSAGPEHKAWTEMWQRCTNPRNKRYPIYKDRTPPPEWRSFEVFFAELGPRPGPGFSLDRIENDKPYGPGNCRWATDHTQTRNSSRNVWVMTPDGSRVILKDACELIGLVYLRVNKLRYAGQTVEEASNGLLQEAA